jgi:hypothetical protein
MQTDRSCRKIVLVSLVALIAAGVTPARGIQDKEKLKMLGIGVSLIGFSFLAGWVAHCFRGPKKPVDNEKECMQKNLTQYRRISIELLTTMYDRNTFAENLSGGLESESQIPHHTKVLDALENAHSFLSCAIQLHPTEWSTVQKQIIETNNITKAALKEMKTVDAKYQKRNREAHLL